MVSAKLSMFAEREVQKVTKNGKHLLEVHFPGTLSLQLRNLTLAWNVVLLKLVKTKFNSFHRYKSVDLDDIIPALTMDSLDMHIRNILITGAMLR